MNVVMLNIILSWNVAIYGAVTKNKIVQFLGLFSAMVWMVVGFYDHFTQ